MRVVIVDNELDFVRSADLVLGARGYTVTGFTRPREALSQLSTDVPDVVIVDLVMPGLWGTDLLRALAARGRSPKAAVLVSAHTDLVEQLDLNSCHVDAFLPKPLDLQELTELLDRLNAERLPPGRSPPEALQRP